MNKPPSDPENPPPKRKRRPKDALTVRSSGDLSVELVTEALMRCDGNISLSARMLGTSREALHLFVNRHPACAAAKREGRLLAGDAAQAHIIGMAACEDRWALQQMADLGRREEDRQREEAAQKAALAGYVPPVLVIAEIRSGDQIDKVTGRIIPWDEAYARFLEKYEADLAARRAGDPEAAPDPEAVPEPEPGKVIRLRRDLTFEMLPLKPDGQV